MIDARVVAGKSRLAVDAVCGAAAYGASDGRVVRCVYVAVGASAAALARLRARIAASPGAAASTVVVCAPAGAPLGALYLAPFAGAALAGAFRDTGCHAIVVYDDLSTHYDAARALTEGGGVVGGAVASLYALTAPAMHGSLLALCAAAPQYGDGEFGGYGGGGSLSALALGESVPEAPSGVPRPEDIVATRVVAELAAMADDAVALSGALARDGGHLNMRFGDLARHGRHAYPVKSLQTYAMRLRGLVSEVSGGGAAEVVVVVVVVVVRAVAWCCWRWWWWWRWWRWRWRWWWCVWDNNCHGRPPLCGYPDPARDARC